MHPVIAVDGPAASGKSTLARNLAARLNFVYVNTGAMYRALTSRFLDLEDPNPSPGAMAVALASWTVESWIENGEVRMLVNGTDPMANIRDARVNERVSAVAAVPEVRTLLVERQRAFAVHAPLVMEGRDIGTVVFPGTPYKFYLDAPEDIRERRRQAQGEDDEIARRDRLDRGRRIAPLTRAADAFVIDSGAHGIEETVDLVLKELDRLGLDAARRAILR